MKKWVVIILTSLISSWSWAAGGWAAIAYDTTTGKYGYAYGTPTKQQAESNALSYCNSANCKVVVTVHNGWASLAVSKVNKAFYGVGYAPDRFQSMYWAMFYCNQGTYSCKMIISTYAHD